MTTISGASGGVRGPGRRASSPATRCVSPCIATRSEDQRTMRTRPRWAQPNAVTHATIPASATTATRLVRRGDADDLLQRGHALPELRGGAHPEGLHPLADGLALELQGGGAVED